MDVVDVVDVTQCNIPMSVLPDRSSPTLPVSLRGANKAHHNTVNTMYLVWWNTKGLTWRRYEGIRHPFDHFETNTTDYELTIPVVRLDRSAITSVRYASYSCAFDAIQVYEIDEFRGW